MHTLDCAHMASLRVLYVYHGQYERPRPRAEISNIAMSTILTKARRVAASDRTVGRLADGGGAVS